MVRCYYDLQGDFTQFSLGHVSNSDHAGGTFCLTDEALGCRSAQSSGLPLLGFGVCGDSIKQSPYRRLTVR